MMEDYKKNTKKELKDLEQMVKNWRDFYMKEVDPNNLEYNETLISDFSEEISTYISTYISNLKKFPENNLTNEIERKFYEKINKYLDDLRWEINKVKNERIQ